VKSDLYRHAGQADLRTFLLYMLQSPGFKCAFWLRFVAWLRIQQSAVRLLHPAAGFVKQHLGNKYGISIPASTVIGPGLCIDHFGGIFVNGSCVIGKDCTVSQNVTLGRANRGRRRGAPVIGDRVYIGPGAKVVGAVRVGSDVAIGANAVVTEDVPDSAVVGGVPAKVLSYDGSAGYVNRTDYPTPLD